MLEFLLGPINIVKTNMVVFSSISLITILQIISNFVGKARKFLYFITSFLSVFLLFFISFFSYIVGKGNADFITHISNPLNGFFVFFLQSVINIWEIFENEIVFETSKTIDKMDENIQKAANETIIEGHTVKQFDDIKKEAEQASTSVIFETKKFIKNVLVIFSSLFSYIYLFFMLSADSSIMLLDGLSFAYLAIFLLYVYLKYEIMLFIKYYATDDYLNKYK